MNRELIELLELHKRWIYFLTVFGVGTVKEIGRAENKIRYIPCKLKIGFGIFHIIFFGFLYYIQIFYSRGRPYTYQAPGYLNEFISLSAFPAAILIILADLFNCKIHGIILTNMTNFEINYYQKNYSKVMGRRIKKFSFLFLLMLLFSLTCDSFLLKISNWDIKMILDMIPCYVLVIYTLLSVAQFSTFQFWLQRYFIKINEDLRHLCELGTRNDPKDIAKDTMLSFKINFPQVNVDDVVFSRKSDFKSESTLKEIRKLRLMYKNLFKLSREMDEEFSYKNLIVVSATLINSTILIFFMLICAYGIAKNPEAVAGVEFLSVFRGALVYLSMIWGLVWSCETTCNEVKKLGLIIQDYIMVTTYPVLQEELKNFATQILHEKINFSPHGFFVLENRMLLSILSAIASHIIILLQFYPVFGTSKKD